MLKQYVIQTGEPTSEPISLTQAKAWLRVDQDDQDEVISELLRGARELVEANTGRATTATAYKQVLDRFPLFLGNEAIVGYPVMPAPIVNSNNIWPLSPAVASVVLMRSPLISVTSLKYFDPSGTEKTLVLDTDFIVDAVSEPPRLSAAPARVWPATQYRQSSVSIEFTAGYTDSRLVPGRVTQAIRLLLSHWYENREAVNVGNIVNDIPQGFEELCTSCRVMWEW